MINSVRTFSPTSRPVMAAIVPMGIICIDPEDTNVNA